MAGDTKMFSGSTPKAKAPKASRGGTSGRIGFRNQSSVKPPHKINMSHAYNTMPEGYKKGKQ